jgi:hypothetical protein
MLFERLLGERRLFATEIKSYHDTANFRKRASCCIDEIVIWG